MSNATVVIGYRRRIASANMANGAPLPAITKMAVGNGGHNQSTNAVTAPSTNATGLAAQIGGFYPLTSLTLAADGLSITGKLVLEAGVLTGSIISEVGLFDANNNLVGLETFYPKLKDAGERYKFSITPRF